MLRAMYTSVSALRNHQTMLDVVANNIANVNTTGYKADRTSFKDMVYQTMAGASGPTATMGGTNNRQVGLGMQLDAINQVHTQGNLANTGLMTDIGINGDGFFRVSNNGVDIPAGTAAVSYQRAGNFTFDQNGDLVTQDGFYVIGFADNAGVPDPTSPLILNVPPATTQSFSIEQSGRVTRIDDTGTLQVVGWISMAKFANPMGLTKTGDNKWVESGNSGIPINGTPGDASGMGVIVPGTLEMSNVDLAFEFTEMIRAQRGFQANSRTITTSDEILQELINLKR